MQEFDNGVETEEVMEDELTVLKARADLMGVKYHPSISVEKLKDKLAVAMGESKEEAARPVKNESKEAMRIRKMKEASELIRVRVTCMNPAKKEWEGEIITTGNAGVGTFKKYIPFNADEGWHIPRIIYNQLIQRQCQVFVTERSKNGVSIRKGKLIKEFNVEVLPPLTKEELDELARRQAMARGQA